MVLDNEPLFDNCLIKTNKTNKQINEDLIEDLIEDNKTLEEKDKINEIKNIISSIDDTKNLEEEEIILENSLEELEPNNIMVKTEIEETEIEKKEDKTDIDLVFEDLNEDIEENTNELKEFESFDLPLENNLETMQLKKPNQVYFELYKEARNKAKMAKKNALLAYLEAKNIKKTYMLDNLNDSDSDIDAEIDDVSESELEGL